MRSSMLQFFCGWHVEGLLVLLEFEVLETNLGLI
jgi:hypothetical protein